MARENLEKIDSVSNDENTPLLRSNQEMDSQATMTPVGHDSEINNYRRDRPTLLQALLKSIWTSFTINVAVIPINSLMILLIYVDMNTSNVCFEQRKRKGKLPKDIMSWILIWHVVETIIINFWFQSTLMFLFGWRKFISCHYSTIILGFFLGCVVAIYKTILYTVKIDFTKQYYRFPGNALFLIGVVYTSYLVASKIDRTVVLRLSKLLIFIIIAAQFFLGFIIAMVYRYVIIPWFNHVDVALYKAIIAMIAPTALLIPTMICERLALKSSSFAKPGRSFVLVFFMNGVSIILYCIMQADVNDIWIFTGLSLLSGFFKLVQKPIEKFVKKIFHRLWQYIGDVCHCFRRGEEVTPHDTDHHRRLEVDKDIQIILYENNALIISQAYLALYLIINFDIDVWDVLKQPLIRISIALGINFVANCLFVLIHIHWYNTRFREVWCKHWKRHVMANVLVCSMTIWYFTAVLLTVFRVPKSHDKEGLKIKNCTVPSML